MSYFSRSARNWSTEKVLPHQKPQEQVYRSRTTSFTPKMKELSQYPGFRAIILKHVQSPANLQKPLKKKSYSEYTDIRTSRNNTLYDIYTKKRTCTLSKHVLDWIYKH